jgi:transposase
LHGRFGEHHAVLLRLHLDHIDHLDATIAALDARVDEVMGPFAAPIVELLVTIPGVGRRVAEVVIAEIGVDMSVFAWAALLASWAAVCPGNNSSAG